MRSFVGFLSPVECRMETPAWSNDEWDGKSSYDRALEMFNGCKLCAGFYMTAIVRIPWGEDGVSKCHIWKWSRDETYKLWEDHKNDAHKKKHHVGNGTYSGPFAFTLTKSPKDPHTVGDMLAAVRKVMRQKSQPVVKYVWYYEDKGRDDNGDPIHPHIHGMYETVDGKRIEKKHWKRAWNIWDPDTPCGKGFRGGYHREVRSDEGYANYIRKDGGMSESFGFDELTE